MNWYYRNESGEVVGPISEETLKELNATGALKVETQVCREGTQEWISLAEALGAGAASDATADADTEDVPAETVTEYNDSGEPIDHPDDRQGETPKHSFAERLKNEAKASWSDIKRSSRKASVHAQIEKLKQVDLRTALFALGKRCYESGLMESELEEQFQAIRDLDTTIASKREISEAEADETKLAALKRLGKYTAKASHAQALTVRRHHLITKLGRQANARMTEECRPGLEAEIATVEDVERNLLIKAEEVRILGVGHAKGWRNRTPAIAVAAVLILLLLAGSSLGLRIMGVGKDDYFVTSKSQENQQKADEPFHESPIPLFFPPGEREILTLEN
jgi:hypothetical protein